MKVLLISILLSFSSLAYSNTGSLEELGGLTDYTCIVTLERMSTNTYQVMQSCDDDEAPAMITDSQFAPSSDQVMLQIIDKMREKGFSLVVSSGQKLIFQKFDREAYCQ